LLDGREEREEAKNDDEEKAEVEEENEGELKASELLIDEAQPFHVSPVVDEIVPRLEFEPDPEICSKRDFDLCKDDMLGYVRKVHQAFRERQQSKAPFVKLQKLTKVFFSPCLFLDQHSQSSRSTFSINILDQLMFTNNILFRNCLVFCLLLLRLTFFSF